MSDFEISTKKILRLLGSFDLFQQNVSLKLQGNFRVSLTIGKIFSLTIIIFLLYSFVESDMIKGTNPIVLQQPFEYDQRLTLNFTNGNILMAFGITDDYNQIYDEPTIFNTTIRKGFVINGSQNTFEDSKFENCQKKYFERYPDFSTKMEINGAKCFSENFNLKGFWDEPYLEYLEVDVAKCQNSSFSPIICKSDQEISDFMQGKYFSQWIEQKRIDLKSLDNPISGKIKNYYKSYQTGQERTTRFFIKKITMQTDTGIIFSQIKEENTYGFDKLEDDSLKSDTQFFTIVIYASDVSILIERRYQKLFDLFASLGGLMNILFIVASFIVEFAHNWKLNELIMNKLYVFIDKTPKKLVRANFLGILTRKLIPKVKHLKDSEKSIAIKSANFEYQTRLHLSLSEKIKLFFRKRDKLSQKEKLYSEFMKKSNIKIDILNLLKRLEEIEKLKLILFDDRQLALFNSINKKQINKNDSKEISKFNLDIKNLNQEQIQMMKQIMRGKELLATNSYEKKMFDLISQN